MSTSETMTINPRSPENGLTAMNGYAVDEPISEDGHYVSEAQYWADYYESTEFTYEWNNGRLEQKPMSDYAQFLLYTWFFDLLKDFLHVNPVARMVGLELGFRMKLAVFMSPSSRTMASSVPLCSLGFSFGLPTSTVYPSRQ